MVDELTPLDPYPDDDEEPPHDYEPTWPDDVPIGASNGHGLLLPSRPFCRIPIDLTAPLDPPEILEGWLYAGRLTVLASEPGVGKSWVATWLAKRCLDKGWAVVYLDEEGGPELVTERLIALGADPKAVAERLFYYAFEARTWSDEDIIALRAVLAEAEQAAPVKLAVLDSLPDFLEAAGRDEDKARDVTHFVNTVLSTLRSHGVAQLVLDHLSKPQLSGDRPKRSRYSRGSGAKLAKADSTLLLEVVDEFDVKTSGRLRLWKTKDRRGRLSLPGLTKAGRDIDVRVAPGEVEFREIEAPPPAPYDGPTECMSAVLAALRASPDERFSKRSLVKRMRLLNHPFRDVTVRESADRLHLAGAISHAKGPRDSDLYWFSSTGMQSTTPSMDEDF